MIGEPPRAGSPAPAPLQVPAVKEPDLPCDRRGISDHARPGTDAGNSAQARARNVGHRAEFPCRTGPTDAAAGGPKDQRSATSPTSWYRPAYQSNGSPPPSPIATTSPIAIVWSPPAINSRSVHATHDRAPSMIGTSAS